MDPFLGFVNKMMEVREADMAKREADMMERMRLEVKLARLEAAMDGSRVAPLTSVASDVCALRPHAAPPPSMSIDRADTAPASVVDEFDVLSPRGGDVAVASGVELSLLDGSVLTPTVVCVLQRRHGDWTLRSKQGRLLTI